MLKPKSPLFCVLTLLCVSVVSFGAEGSDDEQCLKDVSRLSGNYLYGHPDTYEVRANAKKIPGLVERAEVALTGLGARSQALAEEVSKWASDAHVEQVHANRLRESVAAIQDQLAQLKKQGGWLPSKAIKARMQDMREELEALQKMLNEKEKQAGDTQKQTNARVDQLRQLNDQIAKTRSELETIQKLQRMYELRVALQGLGEGDSLSLVEHSPKSYAESLLALDARVFNDDEFRFSLKNREGEPDFSAIVRPSEVSGTVEFYVSDRLGKPDPANAKRLRDKLAARVQQLGLKDMVVVGTHAEITRLGPSDPASDEHDQSVVYIARQTDDEAEDPRVSVLETLITDYQWTGSRRVRRKP